MEVRNGFTTVRAVIDDGAESRFGDSELARNFSRGQQQMSENFLIRSCGFANPGNGLAGNDQDMSGSLRGNIPEGTTHFIPMNDVSRDLSVINLFKKRFHVGARITAKAGIASLGNG